MCVGGQGSVCMCLYSVKAITCLTHLHALLCSARVEAFFGFHLAQNFVEQLFVSLQFCSTFSASHFLFAASSEARTMYVCASVCAPVCV